jgi:UDP-2-acetamido-2,6-beta-L-arabino-hexul-4-ose reductase
MGDTNTAKMRILITGSKGFIGKNLSCRLSAGSYFEVLHHNRGDSSSDLEAAVKSSHAIVHLAGANRPPNDDEFEATNVQVSQHLAECVASLNPRVPVLYASSVQALQETPYGTSKRRAEEVFTKLSSATKCPIGIFRLPNVFGKWCRPNYNSVVATFCHNLTIGKPLDVHAPEKFITLAYVDDVIASFLYFLTNTHTPEVQYFNISPTYTVTLKELAEKLSALFLSRDARLAMNVGAGLDRALYATLLSYIPPDKFSTPIPRHRDDRGDFVEFIKTQSAGQVSVFTCKPGFTRGGHYHHTKSERFLVIQGTALFKFRQVSTGQEFSITASGCEPIIVETVPGWWHQISNTCNIDLVVAVWANECFDPNAADTYL